MFYCTNKRPLHRLKRASEVTERGECSHCFTATTGYMWGACIFAEEKKIYVLKLDGQNFPIVEKCKVKPMKCALAHPVYIGTGTKSF